MDLSRNYSERQREKKLFLQILTMQGIVYLTLKVMTWHNRTPEVSGKAESLGEALKGTQWKQTLQPKHWGEKNSKQIHKGSEQRLCKIVRGLLKCNQEIFSSERPLIPKLLHKVVKQLPRKSGGAHVYCGLLCLPGFHSTLRGLILTGILLFCASGSRSLISRAVALPFCQHKKLRHRWIFF